MIHGYSVARIREAESRAIARAGGDALMQRAAAGLAAAILRRLHDGRLGTGRGGAYGSRVLLVVGSGNNGGDALFAGARLARRGVRVGAWRTGPGVHPGGWDAFLAAGGRDLDAAAARAELPRTDCVVDGVAGIGSRPGLAADVAAFASACVELRVPVVAVDLPSGLAPEPPFSQEPHVVARLTVTFGGHKVCQLLEPTRSACGEVELVDLGLDLSGPAVTQWTDADLASAWPVPDAGSDKYSRGVVGLDTGSVDYPGAAVLTAAGAVGAGAGWSATSARPRWPPASSTGSPTWSSARDACRPWCSAPAGATGRTGVVARAVGAGVPLVVDADALRHLPERGHAGVLLTPHAGELARLLGTSRPEVEADPPAAVRAAADATGCRGAAQGRDAIRRLARGRPDLGSRRRGPRGRPRRGRATCWPEPAGACWLPASARPRRPSPPPGSGRSPPGARRGRCLRRSSPRPSQGQSGNLRRIRECPHRRHPASQGGFSLLGGGQRRTVAASRPSVWSAPADTYGTRE
ncbi:MAG: NAD(P)H-hydrate epimerase [Propionicimonas sp.]